jgi:3-hydroxyacyl-CoA dehydrogenase
MSTSHLDRLTVLGAGVLGSQIAWHSAFKGKTVVVYDPFPDALETARTVHATYAQLYRAQLGASEADIAATRARLTFAGDLRAAVSGADFVIEAVPEVPDIKTRVYRDMADLLPPRTLVATNSSTFLPRDFAEATGRPEKFGALHFANLIWAVNLAEVMAHAGTARETLTAVTHFAIEIGMVPIPVQKEQNGYVLNSWLVPMLTAGVSLVVNGVATRRTWTGPS